MMSEFFEKLKKRHADSENKQYGDIISECEKLGCGRDFVMAFQTRMNMFPMRQTEAFMHDCTGNRLLQYWTIYLEGMIRLRPEHTKHSEWVQCLSKIRSM